jgi:hypothetical protein
MTAKITHVLAIEKKLNGLIIRSPKYEGVSI